MPRNLTARGLRAAQMETTNSAWLALVTISFAPPETTVYRIVNNTTPIISRGATFTPTAVEFAFPEDSLDRAPQTEITIDNVSLEFIDLLRRVVDPPRMKIEIALSDAPDVVELALDELLLRNVQWDEHRITGTLQIDDVFGLAFPGFHSIYDPIQFPGLFA